MTLYCSDVLLVPELGGYCCNSCHEDADLYGSSYPLMDSSPPSRRANDRVTLLHCCGVDAPKSRADWAKIIRAARARGRR